MEPGKAKEEKTRRSEQIARTAMANPLDKLEQGARKRVEGLMIERMADNDKIVTRCMADPELQGSVYPILARDLCSSQGARAK